MTEVVSVKFKNRGKTYYFDPDGNTVAAGDDVIVETSKGLEYANCVMGNHYIPDEKWSPPSGLSSAWPRRATSAWPR